MKYLYKLHLKTNSWKHILFKKPVGDKESILLEQPNETFLPPHTIRCCYFRILVKRLVKLTYQIYISPYYYGRYYYS